MLKRYNLDHECIQFSIEKGINILHEYEETGSFVNITDCIVAEQDNMMMGDSLDALNAQIQKQIKNDGPFDVMIILANKDITNESMDRMGPIT